MALVFVGFMGAGKSSALDDVLDTDKLVEDQLEMPIASFFAAYGERKFRRREEPIVLRALRSGAPAIALGGGSVLSPTVREALREHTVVWLDVSDETAWARAAGEERPLAADREAFEALHAERRPLYASIADAFLPEGDRLVRRARPALEALAQAPSGTKLVWAVAGGSEYPVFVGRGLIGGLPRPGRRAFVVTDSNVGPTHGARLRDTHRTITIPAGEEHKTLAVAERVWRELAAEGMGRDDHLVALGGVVTDLAGFVAATYQRGIAVVHVPTTLLAMVDAAIGGKTGVDLPEAKNYVGAYHQPAAVVADVDMLATLPSEELAAGYAEVVKTALIAGGELWERVRRGGAPDDAVVVGCLRTKLAVVAQDERDEDRRQVLNLGHTVAHALQSATGYRRYRHGEAVGLGLLAALRLSGTDSLRAQVRELLDGAGLPTTLDADVDPEAVVAATRLDKKRVGGRVPFVLVRSPGDVVFGQRVAPDDVLAAVAELAHPRESS
ncbi:MAG: bifunctional shikimate kinase/3-dehydroquinate synthase [Actinobacteria bacterium]|nr:bifunctional shikimate kinase/3-dehydroquinate synthase [Actinomycetota bacterium]